MAPPFLSLSSSSFAAKKFPNAMGIYKLSQTTMGSHKLVGYSFTEGFYLFKDYSQPTSEFVTKVPFSRKEDDLILFHNESGWFMKIQRLQGGVEFVKDQTMTLEPMQTREEHGIRCFNSLILSLRQDLNPRLPVQCLAGRSLQPHLWRWSEGSHPGDPERGPGSRSLCGGD